MAKTDLQRFIMDVRTAAGRSWGYESNVSKNFKDAYEYLSRRYKDKKWKIGTINLPSMGGVFWYITEQDAGNKKIIFDSNAGRLEVI